MSGFDYNDVSLQVLRVEDQGVYQFGVLLDGAFVVVAVRKLGGVDDQIQVAQAERKAETPAPSPSLSPPPLAPSPPTEAA